MQDTFSYRPTEKIRFDHLVLMLRDQIQDLSGFFEQDGFTLTPYARHNFGSMNRLIALDSSYIELLGWPKGQEPQRREIAQQALGLDALVFQTQDAHATHQRLLALGFEVNPVQKLSRPVQTSQGTRSAEFDTVRFAQQPIAGIRIYFCQHLTPELIWGTPDSQHKNGATALERIVLACPDPKGTAAILSKLSGHPVRHQQGDPLIELGNCNIRLSTMEPIGQGQQTYIQQAYIFDEHGRSHLFDTHVPENSHAKLNEL